MCPVEKGEQRCQTIVCTPIVGGIAMRSPQAVYPLVLALDVCPHPTALSALTQLVVALLHGQSLRPSALMRALMSPTPVPARQRYKRVARALDRPWLTSAWLTPRLVRAVRALAPPEEGGGTVHSALDRIRCGRGEAFTRGVVWRGRVAPVAWAVHHAHDRAGSGAQVPHARGDRGQRPRRAGRLGRPARLGPGTGAHRGARRRPRRALAGAVGVGRAGADLHWRAGAAWASGGARDDGRVDHHGPPERGGAWSARAARAQWPHARLAGSDPARGGCPRCRRALPCGRRAAGHHPYTKEGGHRWTTPRRLSLPCPYATSCPLLWTSVAGPRAPMRRVRAAVRGLSTHPLKGRPGRVVDTRELVVAHTSLIVAYRSPDRRYKSSRWSTKLRSGPRVSTVRSSLSDTDLRFAAS